MEEKSPNHLFSNVEVSTSDLEICESASCWKSPMPSSSSHGSEWMAALDRLLVYIFIYLFLTACAKPKVAFDNRKKMVVQFTQSDFQFRF